MTNVGARGVPTPIRSVALIDPAPRSGHHETYLRLYARALLELGIDVVAFCAHPGDLEAWIGRSVRAGGARFSARRLDDPPPSRVRFSPIRRARLARKRWRRAAVALRAWEHEGGAPLQLAFFAWLDHYLAPFLGPAFVKGTFPLPWAGLYGAPTKLRVRPWPFALRRGLLDPDWLLQADTCRAVALLDEGVAVELATRIGKAVLPFPDVCDPTSPDERVCADVLARADGRKIVGLLGNLSRRKGVMTLLDSAQQRLSGDVLFLFAGQLVADSYSADELARLRRAVAHPPLNCRFVLGRIASEAQFNAYVAACDVVVAAYQDFHHSSNLLAKATVFERPILVTEGSCMSERVRRFGIGDTVPPDASPSAVRAAIDELLRPGREFGFAAYLREHDIARLPPALTELLMRCAR